MWCVFLKSSFRLLWRVSEIQLSMDMIFWNPAFRLIWYSENQLAIDMMNPSIRLIWPDQLGVKEPTRRLQTHSLLPLSRYHGTMYIYPRWRAHGSKTAEDISKLSHDGSKRLPGMLPGRPRRSRSSHVLYLMRPWHGWMQFLAYV